MYGGASVPSAGRVRRRRGRLTACLTTALALLTVAPVLVTTTAAEAQSTAQFRNQINILNNQVRSLREQLADLERVVHAGASQAGGAEAEGPATGDSERNSQRLAELETDIDEAREWRRRVTGRFEEFENMLRRLEGRIDRLVADVDFRLSALEHGPASALGGSATASVGEAPPVAPSDQRQASIADQPGDGYQPSAAPRPLGTIPADDADNTVALAALTPEEQYGEAFGLLEEARHEEAHEAFTRFIDANPAHELAQNAAYWRAESLYARQMYPEAAKSYALNLRQYPDGRKAPENMVKLGMALLKLGRAEEACRTFAQLDRNFPDPPLNIRRAAQQGQRQASCP